MKVCLIRQLLSFCSTNVVSELEVFGSEECS